MSDSIMQQRIDNYNLLRSGDGEHFPYRFERTHTVAEFLNDFDRLAESQETVVLVGRIMFRNKMGKLIFLRADDETGRVQWMAGKAEIGVEPFDALAKIVDIGDTCGVCGKAFLTKSGEKSVRLASFMVLAKSIRSLPEKFHGLRDMEARYRHREIDLIMNPDSARVFKLRSKAISFIRSWMESKGFMEVEAPTLQMVYGGAEAAPFTTYVNAIDARAFMSISPELYLKRLIVGGLYKVFTIAKNFRNEGIDSTHNPEFTLLESYQAFADYNDVMALTEQLMEALCIHIHGSTEVSYKGSLISFKAPFKRIPFYEALENSIGLKRNADLKTILSNVKQLPDSNNIDTTLDRIGLFDKLLEATVTSNIEQPTFIVDYPKETSPLCRIKRDDPDLIERFELYIAGMELANAYSEQNDPILQRTLLTNQSRLSTENDEIPPEPDECFMQAVEYGMPPTGGLGIGIDRLVMLLTDCASIRDVILFPFMKIDSPKAKAETETLGGLLKKKHKGEETHTRRLYHEDMYRKQFEARVAKVQRNLVWLDQSAFYPAGGGQAGDAGDLNGIEVVDMVPDKNNKWGVVHILAAEAPFQAGDKVSGTIDWQKRYNTMRLHSASHIMEYFLLMKAPLERIASLVDENGDVSKYRMPEPKQQIDDKLAEEIQNRINAFIAQEEDIVIEEDDKGFRTWKCGPIRDGCDGTHVANTREIGPVAVSFTIDGDVIVVETKLI